MIHLYTAAPDSCIGRNDDARMISFNGQLPASFNSEHWLFRTGKVDKNRLMLTTCYAYRLEGLKINR